MLLDTSGLLCLIDAGERLHNKAVGSYMSATVRVTHNYVLSEFVPLASVRGIPRPKALEFLTDLQSNPDVTVVWVDETLHDEALKLLNARLDKSYSLCDAVSFLLMRSWKLTDALTTDHHFEQEGFIRLLK